VCGVCLCLCVCVCVFVCVPQSLHAVELVLLEEGQVTFMAHAGGGGSKVRALCRKLRMKSEWYGCSVLLIWM
jgi:hypothetical protein